MKRVRFELDNYDRNPSYLGVRPNLDHDIVVALGVAMEHGRDAGPALQVLQELRLFAVFLGPVDP